MKVLIVVHPNEIKDTKYWCYDILYKEEPLDKVTRKKLVKDGLEYDVPDCQYVQKYVKSGWKYFTSGDTFYGQDILEEKGIKGKDDLNGLANYLRKRFPNAEVIVEH